MNISPKFTVVIACYNTAPYLPKALESVAGQTFHDFEVICYVEESTDDSLAICQKMAEHDSRFTVVTAPKSGAVATTRNYGIDHARGEYLVVLDGDDWIVPDMLEKISVKLEKTGPLDVLAFAAFSVSDGDSTLSGKKRFSNFNATDANEVFSGLDAIRLIGQRRGECRNFTWLNIYRTDFLRERNIRQTDGILMEDMESTPRILFFAKRVAYLDEALYIYRRRANSLTTEASPRILHDLAHQLRSLLFFVNSQTIPNDILSIWSNQWVSLLYWFMFSPVSSRKISDDDRKHALKDLFEGDGKEAFISLAKLASFPKRLALPLLYLVANGIHLPAKLYFQKLYYPLIEMRD